MHNHAEQADLRIGKPEILLNIRKQEDHHRMHPMGGGMPEADKVYRALAFDIECGGSVCGAHDKDIDLLQKNGSKIYFLLTDVARELGRSNRVSMIGQVGSARSAQAPSRFSIAASDARRL